MRAFRNPAVQRNSAFRGLFTDDDYQQVNDWFTRHSHLLPSRLVALPSLARDSGFAAVHAKDESARFGLNAFKIIGVTYAVARLEDAALKRGLVCATAGNHGRAVARVARQHGVPCTVFIPRAGTLTPAEARTRSARVNAMTADGAAVLEVDGSYEEAVQRATEHGDATGATILSDTSWPGYEQIPRWIMAGYTRIFEEASGQWDVRPDVVVIQGGVGGLVAAAASWFAARYEGARPLLIACEPENAACLLESARAGRPVHIEGSLDTIMAGLRCAEPSPAAWSAIAEGIDTFITVDDRQVVDAMNRLADAPRAERIVAGPSGACGAAAIRALGSSPELESIREASGLDRSTRALIVVTEGA